MEKIIARFPSVKLPDELHELILTDKRIVSIFIKKLERKISLRKIAIAFIGGAFAHDIFSVISGIEPEIEKIEEVQLNRNSLSFYWKEIDKIYLNEWKNMIKIKVYGRVHKYILNPDDFDEIKDILDKPKK